MSQHLSRFAALAQHCQRIQMWHTKHTIVVFSKKDFVDFYCIYNGGNEKLWKTLHFVLFWLLHMQSHLHLKNILLWCNTDIFLCDTVICCQGIVLTSRHHSNKKMEKPRNTQTHNWRQEPWRLKSVVVQPVVIYFHAWMHNTNNEPSRNTEETICGPIKTVKNPFLCVVF